MADNFTLIKSDASTLDITATDVSGLYGVSVRHQIAQNLATGFPYLVGDGVEVVEPISMTVFVNAASEAAAYTTLRSIQDFAKNAVTIRRKDQASYRALHGGGLGLSSMGLEPVQSLANVYQGTLTLLPKFPLWTDFDVRTLSNYQAIREGLVTDGLVAEYRIDEGSGQTLTDRVGGFDGTLGSTSGSDTNDPTWTTEGIQGDGVDDYATLPTGVFERDEFSFDLAVVTSDPLTDAYTYWGILPSTGEMRIFQFSGALQLRVFDSATSDTDSFTFPGGSAWTAGEPAVFHVNYRRTTGEVELTLNGSALDSQATHALTGSLTRAVLLASGFLSGSTAGTDSYLVVYDRFRTQAEIEQNYAYISAALTPRGISL